MAKDPKDIKSIESLIIQEMKDKVGAMIPAGQLGTVKIQPRMIKGKFPPVKSQPHPRVLTRKPKGKPYNVMPRVVYNTGLPQNNNFSNDLFKMLNEHSSSNDSIKNFENSLVIEAAERSIPFFESIDSVIHVFNSFKKMMESTVATMQMSHDTVLEAADNYVVVKMLMEKLYSFLVSFKLVRWFFNKINFLLQLVNGNRGTKTGENIFASITSSTQGGNHFDKQNKWAIIIFAGIIIAGPFISYKLLSLVDFIERKYSVKTSNSEVVFRANRNWEPLTGFEKLSLVNGDRYSTTKVELVKGNKIGWIMVTDADGNSGYSPMEYLTRINPENEIVSKNNELDSEKCAK